jgi:hypothetical protein
VVTPLKWRKWTTSVFSPTVKVTVEDSRGRMYSLRLIFNDDTVSMAQEVDASCVTAGNLIRQIARAEIADFPWKKGVTRSEWRIDDRKRKRAR